MLLRKKSTQVIPPMELAILQILWEAGPSTVQEVQERLQGEPAYTTVQTIMNTMEKKGRTKRTLKGKAHIYRAAVTQDMAEGGVVRDVVERVFRGSVEGLLMNLVKTKQLDEKVLERLKQRIASRKGKP
jgi:predicted transcriptional regulator